MTDISLNEARVEDRALIAAVMHRYCHMAKENADFAGMSVLYSEDARIRFPDGTEVDPTDMHKVVEGEEPKFIRHHATTLDIQFVSDIEADVTTMFIAITDEAAPDHWGHWRDRFVTAPSNCSPATSSRPEHRPVSATPVHHPGFCSRGTPSRSRSRSKASAS